MVLLVGHLSPPSVVAPDSAPSLYFTLTVIGGQGYSQNYSRIILFIVLVNLIHGPLSASDDWQMSEAAGTCLNLD